MQPSVQPPEVTSPGKGQRQTELPGHAEGHSFAPPARTDFRADILTFLDEQLHQPLMAAEPHPLSEEHRLRLVNAQEAVREEMALLGQLATADEMILTLMNRIETGALDAFDEDIRFLGFRSLEDLGRELAERAQAAGIACQAAPARPKAVENGLSQADQPREKEHQDLLLDEGIEETFPASDPVSVSTPDAGKGPAHRRSEND